MIKVFFLGNDKRTNYLKEMYEKENIVSEDINDCNFVFVSIPFTKDGVHVGTEDTLIDDVISKCKNKTIITGGIKDNIRKKLEDNNIKYLDIMDLDETAILNAIPTAEGAIYKAMEYRDKTIHGSNVLVLGFGRVGKVLSDKLKGLNANVFCEARNKKDLALINALGYNVVEINDLESYLGNMDIIFSTIPSMILSQDKLNLINTDAIIIDLASNPGSVDYVEAEKLGIKAYLELGIPNKVAPYSAAWYLKEVIDDVINK